MKIPRYIYLAGALLLVLLVVAGCALSPAPKGTPEELLKKADAAAVKAERTEGDEPQIKAFNDAITAYREVVRKDADSPEAAQAELNMSKLMAGLPIEAKPTPVFHAVYRNETVGRVFWIFPTKTTWQEQNYYNSRDTLRQLIHRFGTKGSYNELIDQYGRSGADRIESVLKQANIYQDQVARQMDKVYSGKILYKIMNALVTLTGKIPWFSYWFAIILITFIVKVLTTPLTKAQFKSMREMQKLQPLIKQLQEKYKGDQKVLGEKMMALYREHGVNPLAGCLPLLIQMPILITLYYTIRYYEYQFQYGHFLWIGWKPLAHLWSFPLGDRPIWLSAANLAQPDLILLLLYIVSMVLSMRLSNVDPTQAEQQKAMAFIMPVMFFFIIGYLPSAFVLYWFIYNLLQTWQQYHVIHGGLSPEPPQAPSPEPSAPAPPPVVRPSQRRRRRR